jgi:amino acid adenylation domain-containing protein
MTNQISGKPSMSSEKTTVSWHEKMSGYFDFFETFINNKILTSASSRPFDPLSTYDLDFDPLLIDQIGIFIEKFGIDSNILAASFLSILLYSHRKGKVSIFPFFYREIRDKIHENNGFTPVPLEIQFENNMSVAECIKLIQKQISNAKVELPAIRRAVQDLIEKDPNMFSFLSTGSVMPFDSEKSFLGKNKVSSRLNISFNNVNFSAIHALYDSSAIRKHDVMELCEHFASFLEHGVRNPQLEICQLPFMSPDQQSKTIRWLNDPPVDFSGSPDIFALFKEWTEKDSSKPAVRTNSTTLSYFQLYQNVEKLAVYLRQTEKTRYEPIGMLYEPSSEMMVAFFSILASEKHFIPIDPNFPISRISTMIEKADIEKIVTTVDLASTFSQKLNCDLIPIEDIINGELISESNILSWKDQRKPAYIIFTSGTTGIPKGARIPYRGFKDTMLWRNIEFPLGPADKILQTFSYIFDASLWAFFAPLTTGAQLFLPKTNEQKDPRRIVELIIGNQITAIQATPTFLRLMLAEGLFSHCRSLRLVICGGEQLTADLIRLFYKTHPYCELYNLYGPTEGAVDVCYWHCPRIIKGDIVPIGRPVVNKRLYILGCAKDALPPNIEGEIFIGGPSISDGYVGEKALTDTVFVDDPFTAESSRMYRTGDRGFHLTTGEIVFSGRTDDQVKINGYRIELGEIEKQIGQIPGVDQVAVIRTHALNNELFVAAWIVKLTEIVLDETAVRRLLAARLPSYMIPRRIGFIEAMPLGPTGKIDRKKLSHLDTDLSDSVRIESGTDNHIEEYLVLAWKKVLHVPTVDVGDNFFNIGGDSVLALEFMYMLEKKMNRILHVVSLYNAPILKDFAGYLRKEFPGCLSDDAAFTKIKEKITDSGFISRIDSAECDTFQRSVKSVKVGQEYLPATEQKNSRALFILSPPRSGSTLLRVILAGHSALFSPPELQLLTFDTMSMRKNFFDGRDNFWLGGSVKAVMELTGWSADSAEQFIEKYEELDRPVSDFYRFMQEKCGNRILVDKTPTYTLDIEILRKAELLFDDPLYIHLIRHPYAMIHSFEEVKLGVFYPTFINDLDSSQFTERELAELIWFTGHRNILDFAKEIPADRFTAINFEDLVGDPSGSIRSLSGFLGLDFEQSMIDPYDGSSARMTDGLTENAPMLGDRKFIHHQKINKDVINNWRKLYEVDFLGKPAAKMCLEFGYDLIEETHYQDELIKPTKLSGYQKGPRDIIEMQLLWIRNSIFPSWSSSTHDTVFPPGATLHEWDLFQSQVYNSLKIDIAPAITSGRAGIQTIAEWIHENSLIEAVPAVIGLRTDGEGMPLFCVPPSGSTGLVFHPLAEALAGKIPVLGLQPRGFTPNTEPQANVEDMASYYIRELQKIQPSGPYRLCGMCIGGIVALEMAIQLKQLGLEVEFLVIIDELKPPGYRRNKFRYYRKALPHYPRKFRDLLLDGEFLSWIAQKLGLTRKERTGKKQPRRIVIIKKAHEIARDVYRPRRYDGPISFIWSMKTKSIDDPRHHWKRMTTGGIQIHKIECFHNQLLKKPYVSEVAATIEQKLPRMKIG